MTLRQPIATCALIMAAAVSLGCSSSADSDPGFVFLREPGTDSVWVRVMFRAGSAYDPPGGEGLADLTVAAIRRGTSELSPEEIESHVENLGARLDYLVDREFVELSGCCPSDAWQDFSQILINVLSQPTFDSHDNAILIRDQLRKLDQLRSDRAQLVREALLRGIYHHHPYGHPPVGTDGTSRGLRIDDVKSFWNRHYTDSSLLLGLAGDITDKDATYFRDSLKKSLPRGSRSELSLGEPDVQGLNLFVMEDSSATHSRIMIGAPVSFVESNSSFMAWRIAKAILGGPNGRLKTALIDERGLTEKIEGNIAQILPRKGDLPRQQQYYSIECEARPINAAFTVQIVISELRRIADNNVWQGDIDGASLVMRHQIDKVDWGTDDRLQWVLNRAAHGMPVRNGMARDTIPELAFAEVRQAAAHGIDVRNMLVVALVPDSDFLINQMLREGITYGYPSNVDARVLREADATYLSYRPPWNPNRIWIIQADEMFR